MANTEMANTAIMYIAIPFKNTFNFDWVWIHPTYAQAKYPIDTTEIIQKGVCQPVISNNRIEKMVIILSCALV